MDSARAKLNVNIEGYLATYAAKQILMGLKETTIKNRLRTLRLLHKRGADLLNQESVLKSINHAKRFNHVTKKLTDEEWSDGTKNNAAQAYMKFCEIHSIQIHPNVNFHKWTRSLQKLSWIPLEGEIDELIAGSSQKIATFLQLLKEAGARCGEVWRLEWTDIDLEHNIITINMPEKKSNPRQFKISGKLMTMLNMFPKKSKRVFEL